VIPLRRNKRLTLVLSIFLAVMVILTLTLTMLLPGSNSKTESEEGTAVEESAGEGSGAEQTGTPQEHTGDQDITTVPGGGGGTSSSVVVKFPDPVNDGGGGTQEENPTGDNPVNPEQTDIYGQWIIDMTGTTYSLENLHINLLAGGTITTPDDYKKVFEISQSQFAWESGKPGFSATIQAVLKLGTNQTMIPIKIELTGQVSDSVGEISGSFSGIPQVDAYSAYSQQGTFVMRRQ
jgi:hypothetical protein